MIDYEEIKAKAEARKTMLLQRSNEGMQVELHKARVAARAARLQSAHAIGALANVAVMLESAEPIEKILDYISFVLSEVLS